MKKVILFILLILFVGCSDDDEGLSREEQAALDQTEMYNKVTSKIVGHWKGYEHYNRSPYREHGWEDISYIYWTQEYIFNSDGTCKDISSPNLIYDGTYTIVKNESYIKYPTTSCELFIIITHNNSYEEEKAIWIDDYQGEYLRIAYTVAGIKPSDERGGEASIRYKKE